LTIAAETFVAVVFPEIVASFATVRTVPPPALEIVRAPLAMVKSPPSFT
jgi:hypothetical protein